MGVFVSRQINVAAILPIPGLEFKAQRVSCLRIWRLVSGDETIAKYVLPELFCAS